MFQSKSEVKSLSRVRLFATPWTVAYQDAQSMGFFQARILEWVAISFSRKSSRPRDQIWVSCIVGRRFTIWATRETRSSLSGGANNLHTHQSTHDHPLLVWNNSMCVINVSWRVPSGSWCDAFPGKHTKGNVDQINGRPPICTSLPCVLKLQEIVFVSLLYNPL